MSAQSYEIGVIGGGIVGLASAMSLAERGVRLVVVEAESRVAAHQTGHNSGVIHAGLYYKPGSLKARYCTAGREALYQFCQQHDIPHERCGKLVVATSDRELPALEELQRRGAANGLTGIVRLSAEQLREHEPHVAGVAGLHVPQTGIVNFRRVAEVYAERVRTAEGVIQTDWKLLGVDRRSDQLILQTTGGEARCRGLINCGGLHADRVARMCGVRPGLQIIPFRGEYYCLAPGRHALVRNLIYPVPDANLPFLGVHFTRMIDGGVEAGPNAVLALARHGYRWRDVSLRDLAQTLAYRGFWRMAARFWRTALGELRRSLSKRAFVRALRRLLPELEMDDVQRGGAGVRAQAVGPDGRLVDDFRIVAADRMIHVLNAPSPAATSSLQIGRHIADLAISNRSAERKR